MKRKNLLELLHNLKDEIPKSKLGNDYI